MALSRDATVVTGPYFEQKNITTVHGLTVGNSLTAVGTNRATSLPLLNEFNYIGTATSGTGVTLPAITADMIGVPFYVFNAGANAIKVYGYGANTIDGTAGSTGVTLTNALRAMFVPTSMTTWISAQLGVVSA